MSLRELTKRSWSVNMDYRLEKLKQVIVGWVDYYRIGYFKTKAIQLIRIFDYDYGCAYGSNGRHQWLRCGEREH